MSRPPPHLSSYQERGPMDAFLATETIRQPQGWCLGSSTKGGLNAPVLAIIALPREVTWHSDRRCKFPTQTCPANHP